MNERYLHLFQVQTYNSSHLPREINLGHPTPRLDCVLYTRTLNYCLTFSGPPENSKTPEQPLVIRGTRVSSNETQKVTANTVEQQISPNSDEGGIVKELEDLITLNPDSRMSDVTFSATSERPINCLG